MNIKNTAYLVATGAYLFASAPKAFAQQTVGIQPPGNIGIGIVSPNQLIRFGLYAVFTIAVLLALIYLLWGAINWIMSGGDKEKVGAARSKIIAAIVGLVLVVLSFFILNLVLVLLTGNGIQDLCIPSLASETCGEDKL